MKHSHNVLFLSHGGGPMPLLDDGGHREMVACLKDISARLARPSAIVVVSAHWEEAVPTITSGERPGLIYDYYGFPEESYAIKYPCRGEPELAQQICNLLANAGIDAGLDDRRGFDHGVFVPLKIMYPDADIPCVQLSLANSLDPDRHLKIGQVLQSLDYRDLLLIGSGFSFHNMKAFFEADSDASRARNEAFEAWLLETCSSPRLSEAERATRLSHWADAPFARYCHPREEHLLPLHVCYGVAESACTEFFELEILGIKSSMYYWSDK